MPPWSNFFISLDFLGVSHRIQWKNINAIYCLQIPAFVPEIFKFEKCVKYANEMNDDVINSTQYYIMSINRAILANLQSRSLKLGRLTMFYRKHTWGYKTFCCHGNSLFSSLHPLHLQIWKLNAKVGQKCIKYWGCLEPSNKIVGIKLWSTFSRILPQRIKQFWYKKGFIEDIPIAIKHFVAMATHSFPVSTHLISICQWFSAP